MFFSTKPTPAPPAAAEIVETPASMDSDSVKKAVIRQILQESNTANARQLIEKMNQNCFEKCVPKPGASISSGEQTCISQCMEKYVAAWDQVNKAYLRRIQQQVGNPGF